jgi:hypothetical protein
MGHGFTIAQHVADMVAFIQVHKGHRALFPDGTMEMAVMRPLATFLHFFDTSVARFRENQTCKHIFKSCKTKKINPTKGTQGGYDGR